MRQKQADKLWVRERLDVLLYDRSFTKVGSVTGEPEYLEQIGDLISFMLRKSCCASICSGTARMLINI